MVAVGTSRSTGPCARKPSSLASYNGYNAPLQMVEEASPGYVECWKRMFKCFRYFRNMLQVYHLYVAKVDRDVAHVAMAIHVCFKCMFQMFRRDVAKLERDVA
jgi:hypothetical protein